MYTHICIQSVKSLAKFCFMFCFKCQIWPAFHFQWVLPCCWRIIITSPMWLNNKCLKDSWWILIRSCWHKLHMAKDWFMNINKIYMLFSLFRKYKYINWPGNMLHDSVCCYFFFQPIFLPPIPLFGVPAGQFLWRPEHCFPVRNARTSGVSKLPFCDLFAASSCLWIV